MNWHYVENGQQAGPVDEIRFQELIRAGKINSSTLVWHEGMTDWIAYGQTAEAKSSATTSSTPLGEKPEAVCTECGKLFPKDEMIRHGAAYVCASCKPVFMQKLAEGAQLKTGTWNYGGFWIRFAAKFLDGLIIGIIFLIPLLIFIFSRPTQNPNAAPAIGGLFIVFYQFIFVVINVFYSTFFLGKYGATPGKMACKLMVITADGNKISYSRAFGRGCAEILSRLICSIGYIIAAFDNPQKRALHDHICNTRVIYK